MEHNMRTMTVTIQNPRLYAFCLLLAWLLLPAWSSQNAHAQTVRAQGSIENSMATDAWKNMVFSQLEHQTYGISQRPDGLAWQCPNPKNGFNAEIDLNGVFFTASSGQWALRLNYLGLYNGTGNLLSGTVQQPATPSCSGALMQVTHNNVTLEYINNPGGLRQNFIVHKRPAAATDELHIKLKATGLTATRKSATGLLFVRKTETGTTPALQYNDLNVWDANGNRLPARFALNAAGNEISIVVTEVAGAAFPLTIDPLSSSTYDWYQTGPANNNCFGSTLAAGDVDKDGYDDLLIGNPCYNNGSSASFGGYGQASLYLGSSSGLSTTAAWTVTGSSSTQMLGMGIALGDVNGDGYADALVDSDGTIEVYLGSSSGLSSSPTSYLYSASFSNISLGNFAIGNVTNLKIADIDNDGDNDVLFTCNIGLASGTGTSLELAEIYYNTGSGLSQSPNWTINYNNSFDFYGYSADLGDVNKDGYLDVIVGAPGYSNGQAGEGKTYVYMGSSSGPSTTAAWQIESNIVDEFFGAAVGFADLNKDGYDDAIVQSDSNTYIYSGSSSGLSTTATLIIPSDSAGQLSLYHQLFTGDVNGDGYDDLAIGYPSGTGYANTGYYGKSVLYLGSSSGLDTPAAQTLFPPSYHSPFFFGSTYASGDFNGDGYDDIALGDGDQGSYVGAAYVYMGATVVPVTLTEFTGRALAAHVALDWYTASEINTNYFEVLRSVNGVDYTSVGYVQASGNSSILRAYNFEDTNLPAGASGAYYRLKIMDFDGSFEYSPVRYVSLKTVKGLNRVYPNPATNTVSFNVNESLTGENLQFTISNANGTVVFNRELNAQTADQFFANGIDVSDFPNGVYVVCLKAANREPEYMKFVKACQ